MEYSLTSKPRTNDYDIVGDGGEAVGQIIRSDAGYTVYLLGDVEALLQPYGTPEDALEAFEDWSATTGAIPSLPAE